MHKWQLSLIALLLVFFLTGCSILQGGKDVEKSGPAVTAEEGAGGEVYAGEKSKAVSFVYTAQKVLTLTFNGMGDDKTMNELLDELDKYHIKATFFLPGNRVAEEPEIAREIVARGHDVENNTLNRADLTQVSYQEAHKKIQRTSQIIEKETGVKPRYVRTRSGAFNDDIRLAAAQCGLEAVISYSLNLQDWHKDSSQVVSGFVRKHVTRGGIIALNTEDNPQVVADIAIIAKAVSEVGYKLIPLSKLVAIGSERKPLETIPGYDAAQINPDFKKAEYDLVYKGNGDKKEISLTFDDWGTDYTVTKILDILEQYSIKSSFFLRANGPEKNPNLARAILEAGHEVANHTYSHPVITTLTPEQLQDEVVKAHQIITEAIQQKPAMLFRPPTGAFDEASAQAVAATGYRTIAMYDVTTYDWDTSKKAEDIVREIIENTENGSVILLHMLDDIHTIEALPAAIEGLKSKGYTFVTMSKLLGMEP
ncbi:polysaccharide deacetylase family protein [Paenibacillus eucommiae]|nr:polysaccharide deacetylase family protein [Paenibacillus eucommiae]